MLPTCVSMGERFGVDPDIIADKWKAEKVYSILLLDFEKYEYELKKQSLEKLFEGTETRD